MSGRPPVQLLVLQLEDRLERALLDSRAGFGTFAEAAIEEAQALAKKIREGL